MHLELSSVPKDNISDIHFMHEHYLTTLFFGLFFCGNLTWPTTSTKTLLTLKLALARKVTSNLVF